PEAIRFLTAWLRDPDWLQRYQAVETLRMQGSAARLAVPHLRELLQDRKEWMRFRAAVAIIRILGDDEQSRLTLLRGLRNHVPELPRDWDFPGVLHDLGTLAPDHPWASETLLKVLREGGRFRRVTALMTLAHVRPARRIVLPEAIRICRDEYARGDDSDGVV